MKVNDPVKVALQIPDGNGTWLDIDDDTPLPGTGTGSGGASGITAYGDPISFGIVAVTSTAAAVIARDTSRTKVQCWNLSAYLVWSGSAWTSSPNAGSPITLAPVRQGTADTVVFGAGIILPALPNTGSFRPDAQYQEFTTSEFMAVHATTGSLPLLVAAWSA